MTTTAVVADSYEDNLINSLTNNVIKLALFDSTVEVDRDTAALPASGELPDTITGYETGGVTLSLEEGSDSTGVFVNATADPSFTDVPVGQDIRWGILLDSTLGVVIGYYDFGDRHQIENGEFSVPLTEAQPLIRIGSH